MYLTRIILDPRSKDVAHGLLRPAHFHANIENAFPGPRQRRLWRVDQGPYHMHLLILSEDLTDFESLKERFSPRGLEKAVESREYKNVLDQVREGEFYRFRLVGNPCASSQKNLKKGSRGKVVPIFDPKGQREWLLKRAQNLGVNFLEDSLEIRSERRTSFISKGRPIRILQVAYEGLLKVEDQELLTRALKSGVRRGKAFGCGLLTLAPAPPLRG